MARDVFKDIVAIDSADDGRDDTEARLVTLGRVENCVLSVSCALRGESIRIVMAPRAEPDERRRYHDEDQT